MAKVVQSLDGRGNVIIEDPPIARFFFSNTKIAWLWLIARLWLGYQWIDAAEHKLRDPAWMQSGDALKAFWERALAAPGGKPVIAFDWYRDFIQALYNAEAYTWFAKVVAVSELLIGVALILGLFTGIAAFGGSVMNWSFVMAGTASTNMALFGLAIPIILAWKIAGWYGLDRWVLPLIGTPWAPGRLVVHRSPEALPTRA
ncbi:MAG TPA: DoxX family protein [Chloroflexota bacterium]|nr:DoxX family protein [Chloroflexota bacterium]